uniref:Uncharacterized protein n=1 Tax=Pavo cristatus TaxID=9049 RepID=A0A8C9EK22_PAVCR
MFQGFCSINSEVFLSFPCVLGTSGVVETVTLEEDPLVQEKLIWLQDSDLLQAV